MNRSAALPIISFLILTLVLGTTFSHEIFAKSSASKKAKKLFDSAIAREVEGKYDNICLGVISKKDNISNFLVPYNNSKCYPSVPPTPPLPPQCLPSQHVENGKCVDDQKPTNSSKTKVDFAGDLEPCDKIHSAIVSDNPYRFVAVGDLGYQKDLSCFTSTYKDLKDAGKLRCDIGNHEETEDAKGLPIIAQAAAYCGQYWGEKVANGTTLILGFNSNGNFKNTISWSSGILTNTQVMKGVKNVIITDHKPCYVFPNAHHKVEPGVKSLCDSIVANVPVGVNVYYVAGHDHNMAMTKDGTKFVSGGGGGNKYACGSDADWTYCNNKDDGYLRAEIDNNSGQISWHFYSVKGALLK